MPTAPKHHKITEFNSDNSYPDYDGGKWKVWEKWNFCCQLFRWEKLHCRERTYERR